MDILLMHVGRELTTAHVLAANEGVVQVLRVLQC